tara:strand:- start:826 stop:1371 length:546 start_codon:yes stop_codon:yes gene_type:complete
MAIEKITGLQLHEHHKRPRHMGGTDDDWNISYPISQEDHAIAHLVLARMFPQNKAGNLGAVNLVGMTVDVSGDNNPMWGRSHKQETLELFSQQRTGYKQKKTTVERRAAANSGKKRNNAQKRNLALGQINSPKAPSRNIMKCENCGKSMSIMNLARHGHNEGKCIGYSGKESERQTITAVV